MTTASMRRGLCIVVALVGWLSLAATESNVSAEKKQAAAQERVAAGLENIASTYREQAERTKSAPETRPCESGDDQRDSDLCAQWKAADAADRAALFGGISIIGIAIAIGLTIQSNNIARDTAKRQLRAYLVIDSCSSDGPLLEQKFVATLMLMNCGETPASNIRWHSTINAYRTGTDFDYKPVDLADPPSQGILGKGQTVSHGIDTAAALNKATYDAVVSGEVMIVVFGTVEYRDVFREPHALKFRVHWDNAAQAFCSEPEGNEMD